MASTEAHLKVYYNDTGRPVTVLLDGQDITDLLAYNGLTIDWNGEHGQATGFHPNVTLRLAYGTKVDLDLPKAILDSLPPEEPTSVGPDRMGQS